MEQLNPQDAQFLYIESEHNLTHVTSVTVFDPSTVPGGGVVRFKDIIAHVESRLEGNPMLRRKLVRVPLELDYPYWVDDEYFDIEYHLRHGRLPAPGNWRQFCIHLARYHSRPLDMNKPLWEVFVIEGLDNIEGLPPGCYALAIKIHHAAVDGASLMRFLLSLVDIDNKGTPALPMDPVTAPETPRPSLREMARRAAGNNLRSPVRIADAILRNTPGIYESARRAIDKRGDKGSTVPETRFNGKVSPHKMFDAIECSLDDLKTIRQLVPGCTINDVVLAVCAGGLRHYLMHHRELPDEPLVAWVPINARPGGAADTDSPGNNITAMTTSIHTDEPNPSRRLEKIYGSTRLSKEAKSGLSARLMTDITRHVPAATQVLVSRLVMMSGAAARVCNLFISNVPGPQFPLYMNGAQQVGSYGLAPLGDGMGLFIGTPSYNGKMSLNVISTREMLPDIQYFMECLQLSLNELLTLTATRSPKRRAAKSAAKAKTKSAAGRKPGTAKGKRAGTAPKASRKSGAATKKSVQKKPPGKSPATKRGRAKS
jgi:WS/DGAT/MGAT family acyltransferase